MLIVYLPVFWVMQIFANVAFKIGSDSRKHKKWLAGFIAGNIVGASSIYFLMKIFESMPDNSNLAVILATSGAGIGSQLILARMFRSQLSWLQWAGISLVFLGTIVATMSGR